MRTKVCELLGIEFPILAFSHCRDVIAAVSKAGGNQVSFNQVIDLKCQFGRTGWVRQGWREPPK